MTDPYTFDPERIYNSLVDAGEHWAELDSAAALLEETRKSVLADIANHDEGTSAAAREMAALASPAYRDHVKAMVAARRAATIARVKYDAAKMLAELRRSEASTRRAEMTLR